MSEIVYLNGEFVAKAAAKVSVLDRGFLFGDGVYEVIPVYQTSPFRLSQHLERLFYCLAQIQITNPYTEKQWQQLIAQVISKNGGGNLSLYIQISRGVEQVRNHLFPEQIPATVLIMTTPLKLRSTKSNELTPVKATLLEDIRWQHCDIKATSLLANILLRQQAQSLGYQEAILHRNQQVTEGSTSNVFMVKNGEIFTPEKNQLILGGITRDLIIELAESIKIKVHQTRVSVTALYQADEVWLSSSSREISPVGQINDKIINQGLVGPIAKQLHSAFQLFKQALTQ